jgi:aspartate 1-decarboxylase
MKRQLSVANTRVTLRRMLDTDPVSTYRNATYISTDSHVTEPIDLYAAYNEIELNNYQPDLVYVDAQNRIKDTRGNIPVQMAS